MDGLDTFTHKLSQNRLPMDDSVGFIHRRLFVHTLIILAAHACALSRVVVESTKRCEISRQKKIKKGIPPRKRPWIATTTTTTTTRAAGKIWRWWDSVVDNARRQLNYISVSSMILTPACCRISGDREDRHAKLVLQQTVGPA
jgi:hypothetical protein